MEQEILAGLKHVGLGVAESRAFLALMCFWKFSMSCSMSMGLLDLLRRLEDTPSPFLSTLLGSALFLCNPFTTAGSGVASLGGGGGGGHG